MKVLHINTSFSGGAALCAQRIMNATAQCGVEAKMLICQGEPRDNIYKVEKDQSFWVKNAWLRRIKNLFIKLNVGKDEATLVYHIDKKMRENGVHELCHVPYSEYRYLVDHPLIEWADVIHLHWVTGMLDYQSFFRRVKKPIVWTMHDKYPLEGLLHYVDYPVPECLADIDRKCRKQKRKAMLSHPNLHMVAISELMIDLCKNSDVTRGLPVHLIHNGIDANLFNRVEVSSLRRELGIPAENKVFVFSSYWIQDPNKGLSKLISALEALHQDNITIVCIGNYDEVPQSSLDIKCVGFVSESDMMSRLYTMADYFVLASQEETFAQTPMEAMACGTPVIAYPCSGAHDLINDHNGVVCKDFTVEALIAGIRLAMTRRYDPAAIREDVTTRFGYEKIAREYLALYEEVCQRPELMRN